MFGVGSPLTAKDRVTIWDTLPSSDWDTLKISWKTRLGSLNDFPSGKV